MILLVCLSTACLPAQTRPQLKKQLKAMMAQAKSDTSLLYEAAQFAKEHNFTSDHKRLVKKILKLDPDHKGANELMGRVKYEGKWLKRADYEKFKIMIGSTIFMVDDQVKVRSLLRAAPTLTALASGHVMVIQDGKNASTFQQVRYVDGRVEAR